MVSTDSGKGGAFPSLSVRDTKPVVDRSVLETRLNTEKKASPFLVVTFRSSLHFRAVSTVQNREGFDSSASIQSVRLSPIVSFSVSTSSGANGVASDWDRCRVDLLFVVVLVPLSSFLVAHSLDSGRVTLASPNGVCMMVPVANGNSSGFTWFVDFDDDPEVVEDELCPSELNWLSNDPNKLFDMGLTSFSARYDVAFHPTMVTTRMPFREGCFLMKTHGPYGVRHLSPADRSGFFSVPQKENNVPVLSLLSLGGAGGVYFVMSRA